MSRSWSEKQILKVVMLLIAILLGACETQVQKQNFRSVDSNSPSSNASPSQNDSNASGQPNPSLSSSLSPSSDATPSANTSTSTTPSSSTSLSPSPTPSSSSSSSSPIGADITPPTPGQSGQLVFTTIGATSLDLEWTVASDNKTTGPQLQYLVYQSSANNLDTVAHTEANGVAIDAYTYQQSGKSISGLSPSSTYYFNVIVKDAAGNKAIYTSRLATTSDTIAPVAAASDTIVISNIATTSLSLAWTAATDETTAANALEYLVVRSTLANITTVVDAENNGTVVGSYTANMTTKAVTGLISSRTYYFNVIVKDAAGNRSVYAMQTASTLDVTPPATGGGGVITASSINPTGMTLTWTKATDNLTTQANLQYLVYQSTSNNIPSVSGAETNGTAVGTFTSDINSKTITGLSVNTPYYFMVIVRDASGNKTAYTMLSASTWPLPPAFSPRTEAYAKASTAWTYSVVAANGSLPLTYSITTAPSGATINASTGLISYTPGSSTGDLNFSVLVTDALGRTDSRDFVLHVDTGLTCVWTGAGNADFETPANWIFCGGASPNWATEIIVDAAATRQPTLSSSLTIPGIGSATSGAGGTLTIAAGVMLILASQNVSSDITLQGDTPTCSTCLVRGTYTGTIRDVAINNNATLRLGRGIRVWGINASSSSGGHFVVDTGSSNPAEWPYIDCNAFGSTWCSGLFVGGNASGNSNSIYIDGLNILAYAEYNGPINFRQNATIKKLRNVNISTVKKNMSTPASYVHNGLIYFESCTGLTIDDANWSGLGFNVGIRGTSNFSISGNCPALGHINLSGSGQGYGIENDPSNLFDWANADSSTCTWTGAIDGAWNNPGNWTSCTNGRSNYPDQLDFVIIPVTTIQPVVTGNYAMRGTAVGTGGGTITVAANSALYVAEAAVDTFSSSIKFAGIAAGCTTCLLQMRGRTNLANGATFTLLPNIRMTTFDSIMVGESTGRTGKYANFVVDGGAVPANYPVISSESVMLGTWPGIQFDGSTGANSTGSIDGLVLQDLDNSPTYGRGSGIILWDRFTISKLDHLSVNSAMIDTTSGSAVHVRNCSNSSLVTTWNDLTIVTDPTAGGSSVSIADATCSAIGPITINGQGAGYGSSKANDPNGRLSWQ